MDLFSREIIHRGPVITQVVLSNEGVHGVGVQVLPIATAPELLGPYSLVQEEVPDSAAVQITTAGTGGSESPHHGGHDPVMSKGWSSPSMVIAVDALVVPSGKRGHSKGAR